MAKPKTLNPQVLHLTVLGAATGTIFLLTHQWVKHEIWPWTEASWNLGWFTLIFADSI